MSSPVPIELNPEQIAALEDPGRLTIIRAGPGTGKTRLFVAELQRRLASWTNSRAGIAALSFTNVARDEIASRLGGSPPSPHFVGTLDAFVWRFVVRPFAHAVGVTPKGPRLLPAPLHTTIEHPALQVGPSGDRESLFRLILQAQGKDIRVLREGHRGIEAVEQRYVADIVSAKQREWSRNGRLTHSDCQAVAAKILRGKSGHYVADLIVRRFPVLLVDEFQDTNRFLGMVLLRLFAHDRVNAVVVGDGDQAIFAFGGADRSLFENAGALGGAVTRPLRVTHRFGSRIAAVATALSRSGEPVVPRAGLPTGRAVLVAHNGKDIELTEATRRVLRALLKEEQYESAALLSRKNAWVSRAGGGGVSADCPLTCKAARRLHRAVELLHEGNSSAAAGLVARDLADLVLGDADPTLDAIRAKGLEQAVWRRTLHDLLFAAAAIRDGETWEAWLVRMRGAFEHSVAAIGVRLESRRYSEKFRRGFRNGRKDAPRLLGAGTAGVGPWVPLTVHAAKGRQFDATIVYWPRPGGRGQVRCPSDEWWSEHPESEEREIAYVAVTRAKKLLVLCLHEQSVAALQAKHADFVELFERITPL